MTQKALEPRYSFEKSYVRLLACEFDMIQMEADHMKVPSKIQETTEFWNCELDRIEQELYTQATITKY